jgi:hypothetical protein
MMTNRLSMQDLALAIALPPLWNAVLHGLRHLKLCEKYQISHFDCTEQFPFWLHGAGIAKSSRRAFALTAAFSTYSIIS